MAQILLSFLLLLYLAHFYVSLFKQGAPGSRGFPGTEGGPGPKASLSDTKFTIHLSVAY